MFHPYKTFAQHQITCVLRNSTFEPFDATEVTKSDRRTSTTTLQEKNDIKNVVAASSSKPELSFHLDIHQNLCR
jgi:hypothetical protein